MIHFTCDGCERQIETDREPRYILRLEVYAAPESTTEPGDYPDDEFSDSSAADRDHLAELEDLLEGVDDFGGEVGADRHAGDSADEYRQVRYDLCSDCRKRMLANPLGRLATSKIDFSEN